MSLGREVVMLRESLIVLELLISIYPKGIVATVSRLSSSLSMTLFLFLFFFKCWLCPYVIGGCCGLNPTEEALLGAGEAMIRTSPI